MFVSDILLSVDVWLLVGIDLAMIGNDYCDLFGSGETMQLQKLTEKRL